MAEDGSEAEIVSDISKQKEKPKKRSKRNDTTAAIEVQRNINKLTTAGALTSEGQISPQIQQSLAREQAVDQARYRRILTGIQQSGEATNMAAPRPTSFTHPDLDTYLLQRERTNLSPFTDTERAGITPEINKIAIASGLSPEEKKALIDLANARHDLQYAVGGWTAAYYDYDNFHDRTRKEYIEKMQSYQVIQGAIYDEDPGKPAKKIFGKEIPGTGRDSHEKSPQYELIENYPGVKQAMDYVRHNKTGWTSPADRGCTVALMRGGLDPITAEAATGLAKKLMIVSGEFEHMPDVPEMKPDPATGVLTATGKMVSNNGPRLPKVPMFAGQARIETASDFGKSLVDMGQTLLK